MKNQRQNKMRLVSQGLRRAMILSVLLLSVKSNFAQNWQSIGGDEKYRATYYNVSDLNHGYGPMTMACNTNGVPYIAFADYANAYRGAVKKYNGSSWEYVGASVLSTNPLDIIKVKLDPQGNPWVIFLDGWGGNTVVKKFNGSSWVSVGDTVVSSGYAADPILAFDNASTPYVLYESGVKKFNGTNWVKVGQISGYSFINSWIYSSGGYRGGADIAFDQNNSPYISYVGNDGAVVCKKYDGSNWNVIGGNTICTGYAITVSLVIDKKGTPYIFYVHDTSTRNYHFKGTVKKFDGSSWTAVGDTDFTPTNNNNNQGNFSNLVLDTAGTPFVGVIEKGSYYLGGLASIMKFNGSNWSYYGNRKFGTIGGVLSLYINASGKAFLGGTSIEFGGVGVVYTNDGTTQQMLANGGITGHGTALMKMVTDPLGTPYIIYEDANQQYKTRLLKYNGTQWVNLGGNISDSSTYGIGLAFNKSGTPYVVYSNDADSDKITVKKYSGGSWTTVGSEGFTKPQSIWCSIAVAPDGTPYVAFSDHSNNQSATVMKYTGSNWVTVGNPGFTSNIATFTNISIDRFGNPYLTFFDRNSSDNVSVAKFNGTAWNILGGKAIPGSFGFGIINQNISFDALGIPYIIVNDSANGNMGTVRKFDRSSWVNVGAPGFTGCRTYDHRILIDNNGTPFVCFTSIESGYKTNVMKYINGSWIYAGLPNFSVGPANDMSFAFGNNGTVYCAYSFGSLYAFQYLQSPSNLTLSEGNANNIKATWRGIKNHTYRLYYKAQTAQGLYTLVQVKDTQYTITNTVAGTTYIAYVTDSAQVNVSNNATYSTPASSGCTAAAPTGLTHTVTAGSATLSWTGSASKYLIYYKKATDGWWVIDSTTGTSYSLKGVGASTCYVAFITNKCTNVTGYSSSIDSFCTPGLCAAPTNLVLGTPTCSGFNATWTAVTGATSYSIYYSYSGSSLFSKPVTTNSATVTLVPKSTSVTAFVVARGCNGNTTRNSQPSTSATISTLTMGCKEGEDGTLLNGINAGNISIYPNPSPGQFTVDMNANNTVDNATVEVINLLGRVLTQTIVPNSNGIIHTTLDNNLANGVYMVRITVGTESHLSRIVVQK